MTLCQYGLPSTELLDTAFAQIGRLRVTTDEHGPGRSQDPRRRRPRWVARSCGF